jgi:hypothetical protein
MKKLLLLLCFLPFFSSAQTSFCDEDICVVEFNAGWNKANGCAFLEELTDCGVTTIFIDANKMTQSQQKDYGITVVPTIIVFNGKEVKRFIADISFKVTATKEDVQEVIDEIVMESF